MVQGQLLLVKLMSRVSAIAGLSLLLAVAGQVHADSARDYCLEQFPADYYSKEDHALYIKECIAGLQDPVAEAATEESSGGIEDAVEVEPGQKDGAEMEPQQD